jgi:signal transduction histidine kinase
MTREMNLSDLVDLPKLQTIQDTFARAVGFASIVEDAQGALLTEPSVYNGVCRLIRSSEQGAADCKQFHKKLADKAVESTKPYHETCPRTGFEEGCVPIFLKGECVGSWYVGCCKTSDESRHHLEHYGRTLGLDLDVLSASFDGTPLNSLERFVQALDLAGLIGGRLAETSFDRMKLHREVAACMDRLETSSKEVNEFAYIVSHDLKAPVRAVSQLARWLKEDHADDLNESGQEMISLLLGRLDRLANLMEAILQYSRIGRIKDKDADVDLDSLVREVIDNMPPHDGVTIAVDSPLPTIRGEYKRMSQAFEHLLDNAVKFMDKSNGEVRIKCADKGSQWIIAVADNGPGIAEAYHEKVFQIFQSLAPRDEIEGTGIGLTLVKKIVEVSGGKIWLESEEGKGSTFFVALPKTGGNR